MASVERHKSRTRRPLAADETAHIKAQPTCLADDDIDAEYRRRNLRWRSSSFSAKGIDMVKW